MHNSISDMKPKTYSIMIILTVHSKNLCVFWTHVIWKPSVLA